MLKRRQKHVRKKAIFLIFVSVRNRHAMIEGGQSLLHLSTFDVVDDSCPETGEEPQGQRRRGS